MTPVIDPPVPSLYFHIVVVSNQYNLMNDQKEVHIY
jgi:hypothetical protein